MPPPDDPRRPSAPEGAVPEPNAFLSALGAPFRLVDRELYSFAESKEEECGTFATGMATTSCEPDHVSMGVGSVGPRSGFAGLQVGAHVEPRETEGLLAGVEAAATWRVYQRYTAYVGYHDPGVRPAVQLLGFYDVDTQNLFYGLGPGSREAARTNYRIERYGADIVASVPPRFGVWGHAGLGYEKSAVGTGWDRGWPSTDDVFPDVPGVLGPQREVWGPFGEVVLDLTDVPGHPIRGVKLKLRGSIRRSANDLDFDWSTYGGELQGHLPLGSRWHVLSAVFGFDRASPDDGGEIPFEALPALGGPLRLRGYEDWRFVDRAAVYGTFEYRYRIWDEHVEGHIDRERHAVETAIFYDIGEVGDDLDAAFDRFELGDKDSYGFEIRAYMAGRSVGRIGIAWSEEATRLNLGMTNAF